MRLLDVNDLAVMLDVSVSHIRRHIVTHPAFPPAIVLPGGQQRARKRWDPDEVMDFLKQLREVQQRQVPRRGRPPKH